MKQTGSVIKQNAKGDEFIVETACSRRRAAGIVIRSFIIPHEFPIFAFSCVLSDSPSVAL
jgi:hypothetical protein